MKYGEVQIPTKQQEVYLFYKENAKQKINPYFSDLHVISDQVHETETDTPDLRKSIGSQSVVRNGR